MADFDGTEPSVRVEAVERRGNLRGLVRGVTVAIDGELPARAVEMSVKGVFVAVAEPDAYPLGAVYPLALAQGPRTLTCRAEVVRKETDPRRGIALRVTRISPEDEEVLVAILNSP